jgi:hypothetical protein
MLRIKLTSSRTLTFGALDDYSPRASHAGRSAHFFTKSLALLPGLKILNIDLYGIDSNENDRKFSDAFLHTLLIGRGIGNGLSGGLPTVEEVCLTSYSAAILPYCGNVMTIVHSDFIHDNTQVGEILTLRREVWDHISRSPAREVEIRCVVSAEDFVCELRSKLS